jgi:beta-lactamase class A
MCYLKKIYKGEVASVAKTKELFGFMLDTDIEDRLPANLPKATTVYHKTGDAVGSLHDVGIIAKDGTVFYLGIMTSDIADNEQATKQSIATMAKVLLDYSERKDP